MATEEKFKEKLKASVIPRGPKSIAEPEKELRFTRAAQGRSFFVVAVMAFAVAVGVFILSTQDWGMGGPLLAGWWWVSLLALGGGYLLIRVALRCVRHAYIILSPLGVEIFPFFNAKERLQVVYWSQVVDAEVTSNAKNLVLHFTEEKKSGVVVSLRPIVMNHRYLLEEAVLGVLEKRDAGID